MWMQAAQCGRATRSRRYREQQSKQIEVELSTLYPELQNSTAMIRALLAGITQAEYRVKPVPQD
jgi:hypothetical protein